MASTVLSLRVSGGRPGEGIERADFGQRELVAMASVEDGDPAASGVMASFDLHAEGFDEQSATRSFDGSASGRAPSASRFRQPVTFPSAHAWR